MQVIKGSLQCTEMTHFNLNSSHEMYKSDKKKVFLVLIYTWNLEDIFHITF